MTKQQAYEYGFSRGIEAFENVDVQPGEDHGDAAHEAEQNSRQFWSGNPLPCEDELEEEELWEAYEKGVFDGIASKQ